jgi:hypothetical protein
MAYIGREPLNGFFTKQIIAHDGSTTTFALTHGIASTTAIIVSVNAVVLQPDVGYTISGGGTNIIFTSAPNATTYIHYLGASVQQSLLDLNGVEFILDADQDTTITADTDDEIDIKVGGTDITTIKSTGYHNLDSIKFVAGTGDDLQVYHDGTNSYIANAVGALRVATLTSGIAITLGHTTSEVSIADNLTVVGDLTVGGTTNFGDFNITNVGSIALDTITNDGTDITLDSSGDIILDAGGNDIFFKAGGTTIGEITNATSDLVIKSSVSDKDILIKGNDGGATITALTLDMSAAGAATFNSTVNSGAITSSGIVTGTGFTAGSAVLAEAELELLDGLTAGTAIASKVVTTDASIDTTGQRNLTISGELDAATLDISGAIDIAGASQFNSTITVGVNDTGYDVKLFGATAGKSLLWDESADSLIVTGTTTLVGTTNLDAVDIDGAVQLDAALTIGANDQGYDIIIYGDTASANLTWDTSVDDLIFNGGARAVIPDGQLVLGSTAVTSTAAEINLIDGGATVGTTAFADGDGILHNDGGAMKVTSATTLKTYMSDLTLTTAAQTNITSVGTLTTLTVDNVIINGTTIGHTSDTDLMTVGSAILTVAGEVQMTTLDIGGTNVSATAAELNYSDLATLGTTAASKVITADANNLTTVSGALANVEDTLTDGATITWDVIDSPVAKVTLAGNRTLSAPSGTTPISGQFISLLAIQDGTGSRTITWNAAYEFATDTAPTLTTTANLGDVFTFRYNGAKWLEVGRNLALTLS